MVLLSFLGVHFFGKLPSPTIMWTGRGCNNLVNPAIMIVFSVVTITDPVVSIVVCGHNCRLCSHDRGLWTQSWYVVTLVTIVVYGQDCGYCGYKCGLCGHNCGHNYGLWS